MKNKPKPMNVEKWTVLTIDTTKELQPFPPKGYAYDLVIIKSMTKEQFREQYKELWQAICYSLNTYGRIISM